MPGQRHERGLACSGLLKNAIENTPDGGRVRLSASESEEDIQIEVRDCGTGITEQNQKLLFHGFFHTQDTALYSSREPYAFNAGGTGADLLRTRRFAERYGFSIGFTSTRCRCLPTDTDQCPGDVSACKGIAAAPECADSGGSTFTLTFPKVDQSAAR